MPRRMSIYISLPASTSDEYKAVSSAAFSGSRVNLRTNAEETDPGVMLLLVKGPMDKLSIPELLAMRRAGRVLGFTVLGSEPIPAGEEQAFAQEPTIEEVRHRGRLVLRR